MATVYTVKQTAALLGTSTATVRRMADEFAATLPDFQPVAGKVRTFSESDVRTLHALFTRLQASPGLTRSALLSALSEPSSEPLIIPATLPTANPQDAPGEAITSASVKSPQGSAENASPALPALRSEILATVASLSERLERIEHRASQPAPQTAPDRTMAAAVLVAFGVIFVSIIAAALFWPMAGLVGLVIVAAVLIVGMFSSTVRR